MNKASILEQIIEQKWREIESAKKQVSLAELEAAFPSLSQMRGFVTAMQEKIKARQPAVIAEIKKASPSRGVIRADFDPVLLAKDYASHGATCLSVLTDETFFQGSNKYLQQAREVCQLPVLRKDFMVDTYQIAESRALGADCILLIVAALDPGRLLELADYASDIGLDILVEVHNADELELALDLGTELIGINNRDLHSFNTNLDTTFKLLKQIPAGKLIVTESGIERRKDVQRMFAAGVYGFLIGEAFMKADKPGERLQQLMLGLGEAD